MREPDYHRRVVVTGLGVISPVGNDKDTAWNSLLNGMTSSWSAPPGRSPVSAANA